MGNLFSTPDVWAVDEVLLLIGKLPNLVVYGGWMEDDPSGVVRSRKVLGLDLLTLRWSERGELLVGRSHHACCEVRGHVVVLTGHVEVGLHTHASASVEMCGDDGVFHQFPPLSAGCVEGAVALEIVETESESGQVLLIGGAPIGAGTVYGRGILNTVYALDIATGKCTPQPSLIQPRYFCAAARLADGSVICAGGNGGWNSETSAEILYPGASAWTRLPDMHEPRSRFSACVMSDGRFAVFGGGTFSCEVLELGNGAPCWKPLPPLNRRHTAAACVAFAGCVFVVGGQHCSSVSVYDEKKRKWFELPTALPMKLGYMGSVMIPRHRPSRMVT